MRESPPLHKKKIVLADKRPIGLTQGPGGAGQSGKRRS